MTRAMVVGAVLSLCTIVLARAEMGIESFYKEFADKRNELETLRAEFTQTTTTPDEVIRSTGTIVYTNPKRILFRYDDPELHYLIDGLRAYEYDAELEQLQIFDMEDRPEAEVIYLGFERNVDRLNEAYHVRVLGISREGVEVELRPRDPGGDATFFQSIRLRLRAEDYLPTEIHIVNDEESDVVYSIGAFEVNDPRQIAENQIFLPEGTVVIDNDRYVETVGPEGKVVPPPIGESEDGAPVSGAAETDSVDGTAP